MDHRTDLTIRVAGAMMIAVIVDGAVVMGADCDNAGVGYREILGMDVAEGQRKLQS
jgi:hypothetical protein